MKNRLSRGFTLIELLVVIAIIGILSSVVLASLNTARGKGADAAVKSNLNNLRAAAELNYDSNNSAYTNLCSTTFDNGLKAAKSAAGVTSATNSTLATAGSAGTATCHETSSAWAVEVPLKTSGFFCVDSTGFATTTGATVLTASDVTCG